MQVWTKLTTLMCIVYHLQCVKLQLKETFPLWATLSPGREPSLPSRLRKIPAGCRYLLTGYSCFSHYSRHSDTMSLGSVLKSYNKLASLPLGKYIFSKIFCLNAPYFLSISPIVNDLKAGFGMLYPSA
jgi:hypothetical protein